MHEHERGKVRLNEGSGIDPALCCSQPIGPKEPSLAKVRPGYPFCEIESKARFRSRIKVYRPCQVRPCDTIRWTKAEAVQNGFLVRASGVVQDQKKAGISNIELLQCRLSASRRAGRKYEAGGWVPMLRGVTRIVTCALYIVCSRSSRGKALKWSQSMGGQ